MDKKLEKDLFKFTEEILKGYKHIEAFIKKTEEQLELKDKEELITTLQAINYDSIKISPTFSINRSTETKALDRVEEEVELKVDLYMNKKIKKEIDRAINNLSQIHKDVIGFRYIKRLSWLEISEKMNYEERQLRNKKNEAIKTIAIELFGAKVFKGVNSTLFDMLEI